MAKKIVTITLSKKASTRQWSLKVDPITVWMKRSGDRIVWKCTKADVGVDFNKNGTPFASTVFAGNAGTEDCDSGTPTNTAQKPYDYSITITPNPPIVNGPHGNMPPITIDPGVVIDDNGPPGGSSQKKAAKKAAKKKSAKKGARKYKLAGPKRKRK